MQRVRAARPTTVLSSRGSRVRPLARCPLLACAALTPAGVAFCGALRVIAAVRLDKLTDAERKLVKAAPIEAA